MHSRRLAAASLALASSLVGGRARAFDYQEHYTITRAALDGVGDARLGPLVEGLVRLAGAGAHLCFPPTTLGARAGQGCFVVADVPALAADHAGTPAALLGRWLRRRGDDDAPPRAGAGDPDTSCDEEGRRLKDFLTAVNALEAGTLAAPAAQKRLAAADPAYVCRDTHDESQHRLPEVAPVAAVYSASANAARSYHEWHERARVAAALATAKPDQIWGGVALLSELFAARFLQDALAAGRMVTPRHRLGDGASLANRSHHDAAGVRVLLPEALCAQLPAGSEDALAARCHARPADARVYGDHHLRATAADRPAEDVTFELAVAVTQASLRDLFAAADQPALGESPCGQALAALPENVNVTGWLDRTWATPACAVAPPPDGTSGGAPAVLALLPEPIDPAPLYNLYGGPIWHIGVQAGTDFSAVDLGLSWLTRPRRGDGQFAFGLHAFTAPNVRDSGGGVFGEYLVSKLMVGVGLDVAAHTVSGTSDNPDESQYNCLLPAARLGLDLRMFDRGLATALYVGGGPVFCQGQSVSARGFVGLRLSRKSEDR